MAVSMKDLRAMGPQNTESGEAHPADPAYAPPVSSVKLPSKGLTYPPESPLYRCESVDIKGVSAREEDILANQTLIRRGTVLSTLMSACITNRLVDPNKMLSGDRNAVLVAIRVSAYGPEYVCDVICPECAEQTKHTFDLSRLALKTLEAEPVGGPGSDEFEFLLPTLKKKARFRLADAEMSAAIDAEIAAVKKATGNEPGVTARLRTQVTSVEGVESKHLARFLNDLPAFDSRSLRKYMTDISPDVDMSQDFECPECGKQTEVDIPIGTEFFWPANI